MIKTQTEYYELVDRLRILNYHNKLSKHLQSKLEAFEEMQELVELILPAVGITFKEKYTPTFDEWLQNVKGFELSNIESCIEDISLNFSKYNLQYKKWLKNQP